MKSLSVKNVPDDLVERLRDRANRNHRSMQGELLSILERAAPAGKKTLDELLKMAKESGLRTDGDSTELIRAERDAR